MVHIAWLLDIDNCGSRWVSKRVKMEVSDFSNDPTNDFFFNFSTNRNFLYSSFLKKTLLDDQFWIETFIDLLKIGNTHGLFDSIYKRKFLFQYILQKRISFNDESTDKTYFERRFAW